MYQYSFSKRRLVGIVLAMCLLNVLTFGAGLIVGLGLWMPTQSEVARLREARGQSVKTNPAPAAAAQAPSTAAAVDSSSTPTVAPAMQAPVPAALPAGRFALQIGSFTDAARAKQLETELKERGYAVRTIRALDPDQRVWHVVRVGGYEDVTAASRAAADFTSKEQLQALVRRADAL